MQQDWLGKLRVQFGEVRWKSTDTFQWPVVNESTFSKEEISLLKKHPLGNSLAVQWLGLQPLTAQGLGSIPGWGTKIPQATRCGQKQQQQKHLLKLKGTESRCGGVGCQGLEEGRQGVSV